MIDDRRLGTIQRISPQGPVSLDAELAPFEQITVRPGKAICPGRLEYDISSRLFAPMTAICFGVRVTSKTSNLVGLAMKIAGMAYERNAEAIVLSHVEQSGLERFGFRVELVVGENAQERAESEEILMRLWNIVVVI